MINVNSMRLGAIMTNCYMIYDEDKKEAIIIDPADNADYIADRLAEKGLKPVAVLFTHGHGDHIGAAEELRKKYAIKLYAHKDEDEVLKRPSYNLSAMMGFEAKITADVLLEDNQEIELGGIKFKVIHTPGHTPGGCCYYIESEKILFSGDTMFYSSYGRTDFPGGSESQLMHSIKDKLLILDDDVKVYPGHEMTTFIGDEKKWY